MLTAQVEQPVLVEDEGRTIATIVRGEDGSWWATLSGRVPTTLGPSRRLAPLLARVRQTWRLLND
ncbi:MAG: hypothetical protein AAGD10_12885 [Myxococcota bacterium]